MERGSYVAASGGLLQLRRLEVVANNLANVNTAGFKKQIIVGKQQTFDETLAATTATHDPFARPDHDRTLGAVHVHTATDFSLGPIKNTSNPLDVALRDPNAFFAINTPTGTEYTRAGNFTLDSEGTLVTVDGMEVAGDGGGIVANGPNARITEDGTVYAGKNIVGRLQSVKVENLANLERAGETRFKLKAGAPAPAPVETEVVPQALEMANVSVINSMIDLISTNRAFELYSKSAQTIDTMDQTAINQVGKGR